MTVTDLAQGLQATAGVRVGSGVLSFPANMSEWITDRLPTAADADGDCEVVAPYKTDTEPEGGLYVDYRVVVPGQPWWSPTAAARAAQPTPPPAPTPARVVTALCSHEGRLYAACDDGSFWEATDSKRCGWLRRDQIPQPEASDA